MSYAELHCLSSFSFLRGASNPQELVRQAQTLGYRALAITDECSLAGIVRAWEASQDAGLQLIVGAEFRLVDGTVLVALVPTLAAYTQLCALITNARRRSAKGRYRIERSDFETGYTDGLLLWCPQWPAHAMADELAETAAWLRDRFRDRAWLAWERMLHPRDDARLARLVALGRQFHLPLVAAGDVWMHVEARGDLQDVMTAIRHGCTVAEAGHLLHPNRERHLRTLRKLRRLYPAGLLEATVDIAARCTFRLDELRYEYPHELVPDGLTAMTHLRALTAEGIAWRWPAGCPDEVREQIDRELALIEEVHYEHYFLTVEDIVRYARRHGIFCQGRGSAANSAVCYALGITEVDPARINTLFERFISRERNEPPDIDVDFEHERREEVIQYVYRKYGRERAALAATVIRYRQPSALRDVGKALGFSPEQIEAIRKGLMHWDRREELAARLAELGLDLQAPTVLHLLRLVDELVGFPRHLSQHVGGFVISNAPLHTLVPVENAAMDDRTIIQWDKDDLDTMGLLKVDVLALGMLTALRRACALLATFHNRPFSLSDIPADDARTYAMIGRGETVGVFQIESRAQMSMLPRLKPKNFFDLVVEVAIVRPGPIQGGMVHPYLRRRQGLEPVDYPSPELRKVLERTLGVPLFQEQVMQICMVAADFTAGEADQVRRSMANWQRKGGLEKFREKMITGMRGRGYALEFAEAIYQQVLGFSGYGFPESHSASFALLTYVSCWLRCHEHAAFVAALLNSQPMGFYSPAQLVNDARRNGVAFRPLDVLRSEWHCTLERGDDGRPEVRLGFCMIRGLAAQTAQRIVAARQQRSFRSIDELAHRAQLDRRTLDRLSHAGALRELARHRNEARWQAAGVDPLRGLLCGHAATEAPIDLPRPAEREEIVADYQVTGLTIGRHPLSFLRARLDRLGAATAAQLRHLADRSRVCVAGIVTHRQRPGTASGVIFATLEDETGTANLVFWPRTFEAYRRVILESRLMVVEGQLQSEQGVINVIVDDVQDRTAWLGTTPTRSRDFH